MKILFLRIGIDLGCGKHLSPLYSDGRFEYVPIPEGADKVHPTRGVRYSDIPARTGSGTLAPFVRQDGYAHHDPEFETFTYGEPNHPKRSQILALEPGDWLAFYAGFTGDTIAPGTCFVIGYFVIAKIHDVVGDGAVWPPQDLAHLSRNAHFRRVGPEAGLVVAKGDPILSRFYEVAKPFSDQDRRALPKVTAITGLQGSVKRAIGRWVKDPERVASTVDWLTH